MQLLGQVIRALRSNLARTVLTTLGIIIGIAMVITVLAAGAGFQSFVVDQVEAYGANTVFIETRVPPTTKARSSAGGGSSSINAPSDVVITTLKTRDLEEVRRLPNVSGAYGVVIGQKVSVYNDTKKTTLLWGSDAARFAIDKGKLTAGRFYTEQENSAAAQVAVLGYDVARDLFKDEDPVGKTMRIGNLNFLVIGVYEKRGGFGANNNDAYVFVPLNTLQKKVLGIDHLYMVIAQVKDSNYAEVTAEDIKSVLREDHNITDPAKDDFFVQTQAQGLNTFGTILSAISFLLIAVAAISLIVGGVGIMNIMYVVVTERTAEIGLKKALGARNSDILKEFLLEAIVITLLGGAFGILGGAGLAWIVSKVAQAQGLAWVFVVPMISVVLGLGVSALIGLVFGVFPAWRAAKLDPIEALRYE